MYANKPEDVWKRINKKSDEECWNWIGVISKTGYGHMRINYKHHLVHRIVYKEICGSIPEGMCVLHKCDNRSCCNPKHLYIGTYKDNSCDMINRGRKASQIGEKNNASKLTNEEINQIKFLFSTGKYFQKELGKMFGVTQSNISCIVRDVTWKFIKMEEY